ncbi:MAG: helix-turn-helix domain-containing protein [Prolixibacteraceae bacterium]
MKEISIFFVILLCLYLFFGAALFFLAIFSRKKETAYLSVSFILRALLYLAPSILIFHVNLEFSVWITGPIKVFIIPLNYLFVKKLFDQNKSLALKDLWHFLPFLIDLILTIVIASNHAVEVVNGSQINMKDALDTVWENNFYYTLLSTTARSISFIQWSVYSILTVPLIKTCLNFQKMEYSQINYQFIKWLKGIVVLFILMGLFEGLGIFGIYSYPPFFILMFLFLIFYAFYFFLFVVLFSHEIKVNFEMESNDAPEIEFRPELEEFDSHLWLQQFLDKDLYLDPELTVQKASFLLNIPKYRLTQMVRDDGYSSFYSFVNYFRVERSKVLLNQLPDSFVVESVYHDSGFKSRSTYFRVFKEFTGLTPGAYLNKCRSKTI